MTPPPPAPPRPNKPYAEWHWREKRAAVKRTGHRAHNEDSVFKRFAARAQEREAKAVAKLAETTASYQRGLMSAASEVVLAKTERAKDQFLARNREDALQREREALQAQLEAERRAATEALAQKADKERSLVEEVAKAKATMEDYRKEKNEKTRDANDANRRVEVLKNRELNMLRQIKSLED